MTYRFRVWDGDEMHLPPHDYILTSGGVLRQIEWRGDDDRGYEPWRIMPVRRGTEAMHYTDLDDAEGTPIYEGDIVEVVDYKGEIIYSAKAPLWMVYNEGVFEIPLYGVRSDQARVVGNRHETPELLND